MTLKAYPLISDWLTWRDGALVVTGGKVDIGQRISTALCHIVAEELSLPARNVSYAPVRTGESPDEGMTSGSNSIEHTGHALRCAAATLRKALLMQASQAAGDDPCVWDLSDGRLRGPGDNHGQSLGTLLDGLDLKIAIDPSHSLWRTPGAPVALPMHGLDRMVRGKYEFLHDIRVPDMLHARPVHPPHARARLGALDDSVVAGLSRDGIRVIRDGSFLAVAGPDEWAVVKAATRLAAACTWDLGDGLPEGDVFAHLTQANATRLAVIDATPVTDPIAPPLADPDHAARYERPYTMHGALAPSAGFAIWSKGYLQVTTHSQGIYPLRGSIAESFGLSPDAVILTYAPGSGCYGHNGADDAAFEAALVARALPGTPILLKWSREDEHGWEPYGPPMAVELAATLSDAGLFTAYSAEAIAGTYRGRPRTGPGGAGPAKLLANHFRAQSQGPQPPAPNLNRQGGMQRNLDPIYDVGPARFVKNLLGDLPLRSSALRCLGATANVFALESFMDEVALAKGTDQLAFRRAHLNDARAGEILDRLGDLARLETTGDGTPGQGIAYAQYKNAMTRVGAAVDLVVTDDAQIRLKRITLIANPGRIIDRAGVEAQLEGGALQAASWALFEEVKWDRDGILTRDWDSYPVIRFTDVPEVRITLIEDQTHPALGCGEASPGPVVGAIANAVFDATGLRLRRMPFTPDAIRAAAYDA